MNISFHFGWHLGLSDGTATWVKLLMLPHNSSFQRKIMFSTYPTCPNINLLSLLLNSIKIDYYSAFLSAILQPMSPKGCSILSTNFTGKRSMNFGQFFATTLVCMNTQFRIIKLLVHQQTLLRGLFAPRLLR